MEPSHSQTTGKTSKPKGDKFLTSMKAEGHPAYQDPCHKSSAGLEEEGSNKEAGTESKDPDGINGVMEEFIVCLARAVKEAQKDEKHCYHFSSMEHFIHECLLVKTSRSATHLNQKEGMVPEKGAQTPQAKVTKPKAPREGMPKA